MTGAPNLRVIADRLFKTVAAMLVIFLLMQLILFEANMRTRRRAESLLLSMKKLKVGTTTIADVQPLLSSFNATKFSWRSNCPSGDSDYDISVTNALIDRLGDYHPVLLRAGIRPGGVGAVLSFKGDRLCGFSYSVGTLLSGSQYPLQIPSLNDAHLIAVGGTSTVQIPNNARKHELCTITPSYADSPSTADR